MHKTSPRSDICDGEETWTPLSANVPVSVLLCEMTFNAMSSHIDPCWDLLCFSLSPAGPRSDRGTKAYICTAWGQPAPGMGGAEELGLGGPLMML